MTTPVPTSFTSNPQAFIVTLVGGAVSTAFAALGLFHPGFHETAAVQGLVTSIASVGGAALGIWYVHQSHKTQQTVAKALGTVAKVTAEAGAGVAQAQALTGHSGAQA